MEPIKPSPSRIDLRDLSIALVSTYPPTRCGIGRFSHSLRTALEAVNPEAKVAVARVAGPDDPLTNQPAVEVVFDPSSPVAVRTAARTINRHDVAVIQHEYGLYGPDDGIAVLDLVGRLSLPVTTVLHTVLADPTARQRQIVRELGMAGWLVVPTEVARELLVEIYDLPDTGIHVIAHGSHWAPIAPRRGPRRHLVTWGLLGPGKGIERALHALARIDLSPPVTMDIVGQTHPKVLASSGNTYRSLLQDLVAGLGLTHRVRFVDRYLDDDELLEYVGAADAVVVPYDNMNQVCSGVLTDAVAAGRPVVATDFPHARELLAEGAGIVVPHSDRALARAITLLLDDDQAYDYAAGHAARLAHRLSWTEVAAAYLDLLHSHRVGVSVA